MIWTRIKYRLQAINRDELAYWLWIGVPVFVSTVLLLSVGPGLQASIFSAAAVEAPNIYDSQFKGAIARQPEIGAAIFAAISNFHFLGIALVATAAAVSRTKVATFFVAMSLAVFAAWSIGDLFLTSDILENLVANAIGGLAISALLTTIICVCRQVVTSLNWSAFYNRAALSAGIISLSFTSYIFTIGILSFYYDAPPVEAELLSSGKLDGFFVSPRSQVEPGEEFDFLTGSRAAGKITIQASRGSPVITSAISPDALPRNISASFHVDCFGSQVSDSESHAHEVPLGSARILYARLDAGPSVIRTNEYNGFSRYDADWGTYYWRDITTDKSKVSFFTSEKDRSLFSTPDDMTIDTSLSLHKVLDGNRFARSSRSLIIVRDGRSQIIEFTAGARPSSSDDRLKCRPIAINELTKQRLSNGESISIDVSDGYLAGMRIDFDNQDESESQQGISLIPDAFEIRNFLGSTDFEDLPLADLARGDQRKLAGLSIGAGTSRLLINRKPIEVVTTDRITLMGDLSVRYLQDGTVAVEGNTNAAWKNSNRLNETRWERMPAEWKLPVVGLALTIFSGLSAFGWTCVRGRISENPRGWLK